MKLIGIEFINYACFGQRYVPLRPGVQILVGKNNVGKTAILRGLAAMGGLPFVVNPNLDASLAGYLPNPQNDSSFGLNIWFIPTEEEWNYFAANRALPPTYDAHASQLVFRFRVFPQENTIGLMSCAMRLETPDGLSEAEVISLDAAGNYLLSRVDDKFVQAHTREQLRILPDVGSRQGGARYPLLQPKPLFSDILPLINVRWVEARRFARTNLDAKEERSLPSNAESLAPFLLTLQNSNRRVFNRIQMFITRVFPEFDALNPELKNSRVVLTLSQTGKDAKIPLEFCGSGVEQLLVLITFLFSAAPGTTILLDEPHTYLHPSAEREFISLLIDDTERNYVISTHSPVMMNAVTADRIINIVSGEKGSFRGTEPAYVGTILASLGYKNSDFLLYDRLILGEGKSDSSILPILLRNAGRFKEVQIERTGFPSTEGADSPSSKTKQTIILRYEKMLAELEMSSIARIYLRDGDAAKDERMVLEGTRSRGVEAVPIKFLPCTELENYLLVAGPITEAICRMKQFEGVPDVEVAVAAIQALLDTDMASEDATLFPRGVAGERWALIKGSVVLKRVFEKYELRYDKERTGALIAEQITLANQPHLESLIAVVADLFTR